VRLASLVFTASVVLVSFLVGDNSIAGVVEEQVCDVAADYSLGVEDYSEAIRRHIQVLSEHSDNAVAHYHLGFALGMMGNRSSEIREYERAEALGLTSWDLFLNLGLAQFENGELEAATESLRRAVLFGESRPESHFNLALIDLQRGTLADAEHETLASLQLNPDQPDARNLLGVIYAQEGKIANASLVWRKLIHDEPDYATARSNLALLNSRNVVATGETAAVSLPRAVAVDAIVHDR
jgi:Flp pilus assembly protein TadD